MKVFWVFLLHICLLFLPLLRKWKRFHLIVLFFDNCFRTDDVICHRISHENAKVKRIRGDEFYAMNAVIDNMTSKQFTNIPRNRSDEIKIPTRITWESRIKTLSILCYC